MSLHIFGIRHHGPGSARSLRQALESLKPDVILVEGPPDAEDALPLLTHKEMEPPVALLIYVPDEPKRAVYYPFAIFSPEWQALHYGLKRKIPVRFMDLPQAHQLAVETTEDKHDDEDDSHHSTTQPPNDLTTQPLDIRHDPLSYLAEAAGYSDGERWWEHIVEHRRDTRELFDGILEMMTALRESATQDARRNTQDATRESQREAFMRQTIRTAQREGFKRIAVVCGAWHAPALDSRKTQDARRIEEEDTVLLKGLPKVKVQSTWVPWTYGRLSYFSGYGAGIESPGWYEHLWRTSAMNCTTTSVAIHWMTRVAQLLREQDLDASSASVIEAVRLAESLAALRDRPLPGLPELNEAAQTVFCFGSALPMRLIHEKLIVSERLGSVPDATPMVPLQQDLLREQRRLRLQAEATQRDLDLDLRKQTDLERSYLLHRLNLLGIPWGEIGHARGTGTFREVWQLRWQPEFAVRLIEMGVWGNTVLDAATAFARDAADKSPDLPALTELLDRALLANLPNAVSHLMQRVQDEAAVASDVTHLMDALPPLANVLRYGNVRQTDAGMVSQVVDGLVARACIGLPGACASLNDEAAAEMYDRLLRVHSAISLLQNEEHLASWQAVLMQLVDRRGLHGLLAGRCCRLLIDTGDISIEAAARRMSLALSPANEPAQSAAWVEGFLKGSGLVLLHDERLLQLLDGWVTSLPADTFTAILPLLRRTFSTFPAPERRQMGERVKQGFRVEGLGLIRDERLGMRDDFDPARADAVLPLVTRLLGLADVQK